MQSLQEPILVVHETRVRANIQRMVDKARLSHTTLRPHFKTHQSPLVGEWLREAGVDAITVSSPSMAALFSKAGWSDITIALPMQPGAATAYNVLASAGTLQLITDHPEAVRSVGQALTGQVTCWIEADTGHHRTGLGMWDHARLIETACAIDDSAHFKLAGLLTHTGSSYTCSEKLALEGLYDEALYQLEAMRAVLIERGFENLRLSIGDTPMCSQVDRLSGVDEIRPGNFVYYDLMMVENGSCREEDMAIAVACPIIALHPERSELIVHGGAVHLSKEALCYESGMVIYGKVADPEGDAWSASIPGAYVRNISQEHGVIQADDDWINSKSIGDVVYLLPVHACLTADLFDDFVVVG
ncbi:MAG: D-serine deaminase-like pyridoxal phosphate-dependent protein [Kiritimatiellia bacterium]|jgi:D-serine deaminase-like pyridoxal phosphate-dependent protein